MRNARTHKTLLTMAIAVLMAIIALFPLVNRATASAAVTASDLGKYFTGIGSSDLSLDGTHLVAAIKEDSQSSDQPLEEGSDQTEKGVLTIENLLVVNDFSMELVVVDGLDALTVVFKNEAYYANGNPFVKEVKDGELVYEVKDEIVNEVKFDFKNNKVSINGGEGVAYTKSGSSIVISTAVVSNYLQVTIDGTVTLTASDKVVDDDVMEYRKIKSVDGKAMAQIKFMFDISSAFNAETPYSFKIKNINQKVSEGNKYNQEFETTDGKIKSFADPRVAIDESFYKRDVNGNYAIVKDVMQKYTLTFKVFSVFNEVTASDVYIKVADTNKTDIWTDPSVSNPKALRFNDQGTFTFEIGGKSNAVYEKGINATIVNFDEDTEAPQYNTTDKGAMLSFVTALKDSYYDSEEGHFVALGASVELPSLKDLVFDNYYGYESMTKKVYYASEIEDEVESSGMSFPLSSAGKYYFYVLLNDGAGNEMIREKFVENNPSLKFSFEVADDAPIDVKAPISQGLGYAGVEYKATNFEIDAEGCKTEYKLYYNANPEAKADDTGWIEIPAASTITDKNYDDGNYVYDEIKSINYNGSLDFTPDKAGAYKIECVATSTVTSRYDTEYTIIKVTDEITQVKVYDTSWIENNVWSIVFLGVGGLCLIAIVVLLFIKPKNQAEAE